MARLDGMLANVFRRDRDGRALFRPWGRLGKTYVVPNRAKEEELLVFLRWFLRFVPPLLIATGVLASWKLAGLVLLPAAWVILITKYIHFCSRLAVSNEFPESTRGERMTRLAKATTLPTLWRMEVSALIAFVISCGILFTEDWRIGLAGVLIFGLGVVLFGYEISILRRDRR